MIGGITKHGIFQVYKDWLNLILVSWTKTQADACANMGMFDPESFIGSATVTISPINDKEVMVKVFNVTSLTSVDPYKIMPWNSVPKSVVRDPSKLSSSGANNYGITSQTYQFTIPIDVSQLKTK